MFHNNTNWQLENFLYVKISKLQKIVPNVWVTAKISSTVCINSFGKLKLVAASFILESRALLVRINTNGSAI